MDFTKMTEHGCNLNKCTDSYFDKYGLENIYI